MKTVQLRHTIDRYPYYELPTRTQGYVMTDTTSMIVVRIHTYGDERLAGYVDFVYRHDGPYDELHFPYEQFVQHWGGA